MFYSASTGGFYTPEIHGENIPSDAIEITDEEYRILFEGQSSGKVISAGDDGRPYLSDPVETDEQIRARRISEIDARLIEIDKDSVRPLRAFASGTQMDFDAQKLESLEIEANGLRKERESL